MFAVYDNSIIGGKEMINKTSPGYELYTDSAANLSEEQIVSLDVRYISMSYISDGELHKSYIKGKGSNMKAVYDEIRNGKVMTTTAVNEDEFIGEFTPALDEGKDILYLSFSSGLSATFNSAETAAKELREKYPERKIIVVDTLAASYGQGLLVHYAAKMRLEGKGIDETAKWVEDNKLKLAHWFTVENLVYLHRGGRVSKVSYFIGTLINIKPVLHVDNAGHLIAVSKVIGRKKSIQQLADNIANSITDPENQVIFITHGDCEADANALVEKLKAKITVKEYVINMLDLVIGCHSGPGTLAVFCLAVRR